MATFDLASAAVAVLSLLVGAWRGLVYEVLSLVSWVAAFLTAQWLAADLAPYLPVGDVPEAVRYAAGFLLVFLLVVFALGMLSWLGKKLIEATGLRPVDRTLGAFFGLARAAVVLLAVALVVTSTALQQRVWWQDSVISPWLVIGLNGLRPVLPQEFGKYLPL